MVVNYVADVEQTTNGSNPKQIDEAEAQQTKLPYPKSVFFIISNEFCERFNYYGMRTILVLYLSHKLNYSNDDATIVFHVFTMFAYFLCTFGAIISDSWLGKFKTILSLSIVYACGSILLTLGAIPPLHMPTTLFTFVGLALVALGSGGIKPCVSAFGGDQFKLPEQLKQMTTFFSIFYFSINFGSLLSTTITPILREDVHCFGESECYSLAFGVPAVLMAIAIVIFFLGRPLYKTKPPAGNMVVLVSKTIWTAITNKWKSSEKRDHWLDHAEGKYDKGLINDVKVLTRVLVLYLPLPIFWALFDQQGSRWTFQATRMDGDMGGWSIKPDQIQLVNPLLILVFIPLYEAAFYPLLALVGIKRPLQKLIMGGILAGIAFVLSGLVELALEKTYPVLPDAHSAQIRFFNGEPCNYNLMTNLPNATNQVITPNEMFLLRDVNVPNESIQFTYSLNPISGEACYQPPENTVTINGKDTTSFFINSKNNFSVYEDRVDKPDRAYPLARTLLNMNPDTQITWRNSKGALKHEEMASTNNLTEFAPGNYKIYINDKQVTEVWLANGGVYTFVISETTTGEFNVKKFEVTEPNSVNMLWLIPQYFVMTLGEVMFSVTGLEFSYAQAPLSMKSVLQACWLLTIAVGNVIVVIVAELKLFESQAKEFFLFALLMFIDMLIFMYVAYRYQPNKTPENEHDVHENKRAN